MEHQQKHLREEAHLEPCIHDQLFCPRKEIQQGVDLGAVSNHVVTGACSHNADSIDQGLPRAGLMVTRKNGEGGRFPGTVWPQKPESLSVRNRQAQVLESHLRK